MFKTSIHMGKFTVGFLQWLLIRTYIYNAENTHAHIPNDSNNTDSNNFVANRLLLFEHVRIQKDTDLLRYNNTHLYKFEVCRDDDVLRSKSKHIHNSEVYICDDASNGSKECQPDVLQDVARDVLDDSFVPITCKVYHFLSHVVFLQWTLIDCFQCDF